MVGKNSMASRLALQAGYRGIGRNGTRPCCILARAEILITTPKLPSISPAAISSVQSANVFKGEADPAGTTANDEFHHFLALPLAWFNESTAPSDSKPTQATSQLLLSPAKDS